MILFVLFIFLFTFSLVEIWKNKTYKKLFIIFWWILSIIIVFRFGVGADYPGYYQAFYEVPALGSGYDFRDLNAHGEPGYLFVVALFRYFGLTFRELAIVIGAVTMFLYYRFFKLYCSYSIVSLFVFYSIYFIVYPFNVIRQGFTLAFFVGVLIPILLQKKHILYVILTLIGSLFHYSLLIVLILPLFIKIRLQYYLLLILIFMGLVFPVENLFSSFFSLFDVLNVYSEDSGNYFALLSRILFIIPIIYLYYNTKDIFIQKIANIGILGFLLFINFHSYSLIASRASIYFKMLEILLLSLFLHSIKLYSNRIIVFIILFLFLAVLFIKALVTDVNYLKIFNNLPDSFSIFEYPIINQNFTPQN